MSVQCKILNEICRLLYWGEYRKYIRKQSIQKVQSRYLMRLLKRNKATRYGEKYDFARISSYEEFARKVPLTVYEDYEPYLEAMADGEKQVLTKEDVLLFELTSGSSGGKKKIPYTKTLKQEFQRGIKPWLYDLYSGDREIGKGKSYWSITPVTAEKTYTKAGIPLGFEEDAEYFGFFLKILMGKLFAVDSSVKFSEDMQHFYLDTTRQLMQCQELSLISVWNPTFLTILCDFIRDNVGLVVEGLERKEQERIQKAVEANRFDHVFPMLRIISCWADGSAKDYLKDLEIRFPTVHIQPKGLLATECFVSFPLLREEGSRLSVRSHFFEFRRVTDGKILLAHELEPGEYEVIVTTGGGFYRYCIGDIVEVIKVVPDQPPIIRFLRRAGITSDLFGEKLTEEFVRGVCEKLGITEEFCLLAPEGKRYCLYTTAEGIADKVLDDELRESYHYNYCRQLGQLKLAKVVPVCGEPQKVYIQRHAEDGMRVGDIKPAYLTKKTDWGNWFQKRKEESELC
nr:GH3 auxin-responsive promoter family protein [Eubacterium sp.]